MNDGEPTPESSDAMEPGSQRAEADVRRERAGSNLSQARTARAFEYYPCLGRVRDHVVRHLSEEITLAVAANVAGLEYHHFSRVFHERIGLCFRDWVNVLRVAQAMELLSLRDQSISCLSHVVGFADRRTFQRAFKRWVGITPREYRRLARPEAALGEPESPSSDRPA